MAYIDNKHHRSTTMDAREWDRIADLLMQIRKKYAQLTPKLDNNKEAKQDSLDYLNALLHLNDVMAEYDNKGWL